MNCIVGTGYEKWVAVLGMLVGGFTFGLIVGSLGEMARKNNPGEVRKSAKASKITMLNTQQSCAVPSADIPFQENRTNLGVPRRSRGFCRLNETGANVLLEPLPAKLGLRCK